VTGLAALIRDRIAAEGPLRLDAYMALCLGHPTLGYYTTRDPLGAAGDFTTAPEISQMFGECLGLALAQAWVDQGQPGRVVLAELGPGRGTLMADVLRAAGALPAFRAAAEVHLVEASPALRTKQRATLKDIAVTWHDRVETLPEAPLCLLANEFFDALPIRQFVRASGGWRERQVGLPEGRLSLGLSAAAPIAQLGARLADTRDGDVVELCPALPSIVSEIGRRIATHGGVAIVIDYGSWHSLGDTFQAVRHHQPEDPLAHPGEADLTAHVDFEAIAQAAAPAATTAMIGQGALLERLGIAQRAEILARRLAGPALDQHISALHRLTHPSEMGSVFKALAIHPRAAPAVPGFQ
jgi:SAM-dependent MidA family methyltransferase